MYGWADGHLKPTLLGRLGGVNLRTNNSHNMYKLHYISIKMA